MKKIKPIHAAVRARAQAYVDKQLATMEKYGSRPELTVEQYEQLIYDCALPAQAIWDRRRKATHRA